jgi:hypothetical protein
MLLYLLLFISLSGYAQQVTSTKGVELLKTYIVDKVVDNKFQQSYRVTNINDLSSTQVDITKVNNVTNYNVLEVNKVSTKTSNLYKKATLKIKKDQVNN